MPSFPIYSEKRPSSSKYIYDRPESIRNGGQIRPAFKCHHMKYWIIINNTQIGPLNIDELASRHDINPSTPVWHEGLSDWTTIAAVPEIAAMFNPAINQRHEPQPFNGQFRPDGHTPSNQGGYETYRNQPFNNGQTQYGYNQSLYGDQRNNPTPQMPSNHLVWAIIATICCCIPTGVIAIIYASKVSPAYMRGDYNAALNASSKAELWVIISFVAGLIWAPFSMPFSLFSA